MENSWAKWPIRPNLVLPRPWSEPGAHSALASFALNSVASTWLGAKSREAVYVREGDPNGPRAATHTGSPKLLISSLPDSLRSSHHPPGARSAPHHCRQYVTFSAMRGEKENKRKGRRGEREEDQGKEEESKGEGRERKTSFSSDALGGEKKKSHISEAREPPNGLKRETNVYIWQALRCMLYLWVRKWVYVYIYIYMFVCVHIAILVQVNRSHGNNGKSPPST